MKKWLPIGIVLLVMTLITVAAAITMSHQQSANKVAATTTPPPTGSERTTPPQTRVPAPTVTPMPQTTPKSTAPTPPATQRPASTDPRHMRTAPAAPDASGQAHPAARPQGTTGQRPMMGMAMHGTFALLRLFRGIGRLEEAGKTPLTAAQAKAVLAIMTPLRTQQTLTPEQAKAAADKLNAILTAEQRAAIDAFRPGRGNWGNRQGDGQPPAGARPPDAERPTSPPPADTSTNGGERRMGERGFGGPPPAGMENMNPFNPGEDNPMAKRMTERWQPIFTALEAKAKQ